MGKQTKQPRKKSTGTVRKTVVLGLIHSELCGPMNEMSFGKSSYLITFIDDFTRKTFVYFLKLKGKFMKKFKIQNSR